MCVSMGGWVGGAEVSARVWVCVGVDMCCWPCRGRHARCVCACVRACVWVGVCARACVCMCVCVCWQRLGIGGVTPRCSPLERDDLDESG